MTAERASTPAEFCTDCDLGYERSRTQFVQGEGLSLDESYRLAHLPLVSPDHPRVIPARRGTHYQRGRHPRVFSLVMPLPWPALASSSAFQELEHALRGSPFAPKIAWELMEPRCQRLHATLCGSLSVGQDEPPAITGHQRRQLTDIGPIAVELRGLFSGNVNVGRLYLRAYPECRGGKNPFRAIQRILERQETGLYLVGLYNLADDLTAREASALATLIDAWWDRPILHFELSSLQLLWATDDLVLEGGVAEELPLTR